MIWHFLWLITPLEASKKEYVTCLNLVEIIIEEPLGKMVSSTNWEWFIFLTQCVICNPGRFLASFSCSSFMLKYSTIRMNRSGGDILGVNHDLFLKIMSTFQLQE
jgi:hypothetical protein